MTGSTDADVLVLLMSRGPPCQEGKFPSSADEEVGVYLPLEQITADELEVLLNATGVNITSL